MKKIIFLVIIAFFTLSSCTKETSLANEQPIQREAQQTANKITSHDRSVQELDWSGQQIINLCTGELMTATIWRVTIKIKEINRNGEITFDSHIDGKFKMVGESGREYTGTSLFKFEQIMYLNGVLTYEVTSHERIISPGNGSNLFFTHKFKVEIYPDGTFTYKKEPIQELICK